jgi:CRP/FNR family transcriptional regulator, cyclic AMP receptor protein
MDVGRLKAIPLFESFSEDDLRKIAPFAEENSVGAGETLVREGDYSYDLMVIEEGKAEVRQGDEKLAELGPGDFFGEMGVLARERRNADVVADTPMRLISFKTYDVKRMERNLPEAVEKLREAVAQRRAADSG